MPILLFKLISQLLLTAVCCKCIVKKLIILLLSTRLIEKKVQYQLMCYLGLPDVDYITPMCSQVVYEGLVDDIFRIKCGSVEFGPEVTSSDRSVKILLNSQDKVFGEIRNEHFSNVFSFLSQKARNLQSQYDKRRGMDIKQMKTFVSQELKGLKQEHRMLSLHIGACESIMKKKTKQDFQELLKTEHSLLEGFDIRECINLIEEHINRQVSPIESLRLLCLLSLTENGLIAKDYRSLKTQYLQSYGSEHLLTFSNLKRAGLLTEQTPTEALTAVESRVGKLVTDKAVGKLTDAFSSLAKKSHFRGISKKLGLIPRVDGDYDLKTPRDMAYVFSGAYIPLSCKIMEHVLVRKSWAGLEEVMRLLNNIEFSGKYLFCAVKFHVCKSFLIYFTFSFIYRTAHGEEFFSGLI
ncbi:hypothetical protein GDO81_009537 [Engystomops pustulosus]|uniref:Vacuolar protein sorting-associated protein 33B n=1 Tax=Engystomops pustulosus TaxID=76066 RepID=A0AAV7BSR1_ENGPU|nr:hypothetical protein GDO81_009537 [Engystomops pustulosus]